MSDQVVFTGHGLPMRIPFHVTPGMRHVIQFEFIDELDAPVDQDGTAWTATMHDAVTGAVIFEYSEMIADNEIEFAATEVQTVELDPTFAYEVRGVRTNPGPDMIFAGPVLFTPETIPAAA